MPASNAIFTRHASVYWGSGAATPALIDRTRDVSIDLGADKADATAHGDTNISQTATFVKPNISVSGLYSAAIGQSDGIIKDALSLVSGKFSIYIGSSNVYFYGSASSVEVQNVGAPYTDYAPMNWGPIVTGNLGFYAK